MDYSGWSLGLNILSVAAFSGATFASFRLHISSLKKSVDDLVKTMSNLNATINMLTVKDATQEERVKRLEQDVKALHTLLMKHVLKQETT